MSDRKDRAMKASALPETDNSKRDVASLTPKRAKFAQLIVDGSSQAEAYRGAYNVKQSTAKSVHEAASRLMADSKVAARIDELRAGLLAKVAEEITYDYQAAMLELDKALAFSLTRGSPGAFVAALNLKQKISGLHVEDRKNDRSPVSGMSHERVRAALDALAAMRKAKAGTVQ